MPKLKFIFKTISNMHFDKMIEKAKVVHKRTGKPTLSVLCDMVQCGAKYGAGYMDYTVLEFYRLTPKERDTFMTRGRSNSLVAALNDKAYWHYFDNKIEFLQTFSECLGREWLDLSAATAEEFSQFCDKLTAKGCDKIMVKPIDGDGGKGVDRVILSEHPDKKELYESLKANNQTLAEEYVVQHPDIAAIYNGSVNTLRLVTVIDESCKVHITRCLIRIGAGGVVDNISSGGMAALVDIDTGVITKPAHDKTGATHDKHPITGAPIVGVKIPMFDQVLEMVKKAALTVPQIRYCAWDVAVCESGPIFIEGNQYPGHEIQQLPPHVENNTGMWTVYKEYIKSDKA